MFQRFVILIMGAKKQPAAATKYSALASRISYAASPIQKTTISFKGQTTTLNNPANVSISVQLVLKTTFSLHRQHPSGKARQHLAVEPAGSAEPRNALFGNASHPGPKPRCSSTRTESNSLSFG